MVVKNARIMGQSITSDKFHPSISVLISAPPEGAKKVTNLYYDSTTQTIYITTE
jgi:hypothetical protein